MRSLSLYRFLSRFHWLNYRGKIMVMAFLGTHIPLLTLIGFFVLRASSDRDAALVTLAVALVATLVGTAVTLWVLNQLLRPIIMTSKALRAYRNTRALPVLPTDFTDEAGTLMADASGTLTDLDSAIDDLANYDNANGLPNRGMLEKAMIEPIAQSRSFALCVVRVENYAKIGAAFDQTAAQQVAWNVARELNRTAAALGGAFALETGMFAVLLPTDADYADPAELASEFVVAVSGDIDYKGAAIHPEIAAGIAFYPEDATTAKDLIDAAIAAVGVADHAAMAVNFFSSEARDAAKARFLTEQGLRRAIVADEFRLHLQPVIDLNLGRAVGAEALIRWQHPDHGLVLPGSFIPVAESSGLIDSIGLWVIRAACAQLGAWNVPDNDGLGLAINLSARQFLDPKLVYVIAEALQDASVSPDRLEIELTETTAMRDRDVTAKIFGQLRDLGIRVAIDDFGTGYSNMSYLRTLPFDKLKIDREFVSDVDRTPNLHAITSALVGLARGLGAKVVAEGAERQEEVRMLYEDGCNLFQGFYFARPVAPDQFHDAISSISLGAKMMSVAADGMDEDAQQGKRSVA
jgi:EAL domain-containing protein (putative c-di-GMP-specific phosphodiesterase class I)/GGDEF domain-containing protein